ncbi:hypothetical protein QQ008_29935 [Fulvivirgaceae bacterium BMA10]|uniref:GTP cyclohydrolase n=1 Tax=Splendidivirga corallicola TaxID=3051826 RepID=A0ABT8KXV4_9BACT|nr:hypothetical protein [Fulvivirgaceae bacterium BMA10]
MKNYTLIALSLFSFVVLLSSCGSDDDPPIENPEEIITDVTLTFTPTGGGSAITATAKDPDGDGPQDLEVVSAINLQASTTYTLTITLLNAIENEDVTEEIEDESDDHLFFFAWTGNIFTNPSGNGNADNRADPVNYNDEDTGGLPLGLSTEWTTGDASSGNTFRVVLKHQPKLKTSTSTVNDGESDIDLTWDINIQ